MATMEKKQLYPFYCKFNDKGGKEQRVGMEISEGHKKLAQDDYAEKEGRVIARFFNTTMPKETQIRFTMEPGEAYDVYVRMMKVFRSQVAVKDKLPPHKFTKDGQDIMTNLTIEKWVRGEKSGFALACQRGEVSHNVSLREGGFLYAAEIFKHMSLQSAWQFAPAPNVDKKQEALDALTTLKTYLADKKGSLDLLKQLYKMME